MTLELSRQIFEKSSYQIHNLIRQMGAELFHADRRMGKHEANSSFSQFRENA
jgi:hypothetical protein